MSPTPATMHIGEFAERTGMSLRTIRHYDEVGLVTASLRTDGGFRLYSEADFERMILIRRMKPLGFTLEEMAELLAIIDEGRAAEDSSGTDPRLTEFIREATERREKLRTQLAMADEFVALLERQAR
ncbi:MULTISPECIES: MerR family transcriptional regulator [Mycetocola]|uniref:MerR family transcriptional regulator n=1 Tax=Mycetocola TaxID=76634 RepID=UPI0004C06CEA|nr:MULTISPECIES: MerR family transcriptional regulator [Mycetocola]